MATLWDTTGSAVVSALAAERRHGAVTSGLVLTLVIVADEAQIAEAEAAAMTAAAMHPCRVIIVCRRQLEAPSRLDAEVMIGGRLGPNEAVILRMYGRLTLHAESVVLPLLAPDAPVVCWWHGPPPEQISYDPLGVSADRRVTDCAMASDPIAALRQRADDYVPGDTDLAWTRTTPWRSLLASTFDSTEGQVRGGRIEAEAGNPSAALLAGWLKARLGTDVTVTDTEGPGVTGVFLELDTGEVCISRPDGRSAQLSRPGADDRTMPLPRRDIGDLLAEELRRMDADQPYAEALAAATGVEVSHEVTKRRHVWRDPQQPASA